MEQGKGQRLKQRQGLRDKAKEIRRQRHIGTTRAEDSDATFSDLGLLPLRKLYLFMYFSRYFVYSVFFDFFVFRFFISFFCFSSFFILVKRARVRWPLPVDRFVLSQSADVASQQSKARSSFRAKYEFTLHVFGPSWATGHLSLPLLLLNIFWIYLYLCELLRRIM